MPSLITFRMIAIFLFAFAAQILAQTNTGTPSPTTRPVGGNGTTTAPPSVETGGTSEPADVYLTVPELHVGKIELDVEQLQADINLNAKVAGLVNINAGVFVSIEKVNITIADIDANLELVVRLGHLVDIVERVFDSLDLNPLLIGLISNVTSLVGEVIGAVDGLLGSITQGGKTLNFLVDNLGNIVQEVVGGAGDLVSSIVGNYKTNMTQVGDQKQVGEGLIQKTFEFLPLNALVDIVFNTAGQVVQAVVQKKTGSGGGSTTTTPSGTATPVTLPVSTAVSTST